ncbi:MAG: histidinol-phosphate transaminase [Wenzhouxiangellaceae bacterium]
MIDLSKNELNMPIPEVVLERVTLNIADSLYKYPTSTLEKVIDLAEESLAFSGESALLTRGVDEAIDLVIEAFSGHHFITLTPEFEGFWQRMIIKNQKFDKIPFNENFSWPSDKLENVSNKSLLYLSSPNNPTGIDFPLSHVNMVVKKGCIVFLDRTYRDFSKEPEKFEQQASSLIRFYSFSKAYALAGQRLGVLVGSAKIIEKLRAKQLYCHIDTFSLAILVEVFRNGWGRRYGQKTIKLRNKFVSRLQGIGINAINTETNFILINSSASFELAKFLETKGYLVRLTDSLGLPEYIRIAVGDDSVQWGVIRSLKEWQKIRGNSFI